MTSYSTTHDGLERIVEGAHTVSRIVGPSRGMHLVPTFVLTGLVAAAVAVLGRNFGDVFGDGLTGEWLSMWVLASVAILVLAKTSAALSSWLSKAVGRGVAAWKQSADDARFQDAMDHDPRLRTDFMAARLRSELDASR